MMLQRACDRCRGVIEEIHAGEVTHTPIDGDASPDGQINPTAMQARTLYFTPSFTASTFQEHASGNATAWGATIDDLCDGCRDKLQALVGTLVERFRNGERVRIVKARKKDDEADASQGNPSDKDADESDGSGDLPPEVDDQPKDMEKEGQ